MAICKQCSGKFEAKRADAKYCSDTCRAMASKVAHKPVALSGVAPTVALNPVYIALEEAPRWLTPLQWRAWMREHRPEYLAVLCYQAVGGEAGYRDCTELKDGEFNRVAKPGDSDYEGPKGSGVCLKCGAETPSPLVSCCYGCVAGKPIPEPGAVIPVKNFAEMAGAV